jgi:uncharacterized protein (TIGR02147 family)
MKINLHLAPVGSILFTTMADLFEYTDYCAFLRDYFEEKRRKLPFFSYRFFGHKVGVDPGNLVKILQGKRHLSEAGTKRFIHYARYSEREAKYFETLVRFKKAKKERDNKILFERLMAIQRIDPHRLEPAQYEYYLEWYHTVVLALLHMMDFRGDCRSLAEKTVPRISVKQAEASIALLLKLSLISKEPGGRLVPTNTILTTGKNWKSIAVRSFQRQSIGMALEALERFTPEERDISTVSIAAAKEDMEEIKRVTGEYRRTILQIASASEKPDRVYQLNVQFFPLSVQESRA